MVPSSGPGGAVEAAVALTAAELDGGAHHPTREASTGTGRANLARKVRNRRNPNPKIWGTNSIGGDAKEGNGKGEEATACRGVGVFIGKAAMGRQRRTGKGGLDHGSG